MLAQIACIYKQMFEFSLIMMYARLNDSNLTDNALLYFVLKK